MAKQPARHGKHWTPEEIKELRHLAKGNTPTRVIGIKLGRTESSVETKADEMDITLMPPNQPPYGTKK